MKLDGVTTNEIAESTGLTYAGVYSHVRRGHFGPPTARAGRMCFFSAAAVAAGLAKHLNATGKKAER